MSRVDEALRRAAGRLGIEPAVSSPRVRERISDAATTVEDYPCEDPWRVPADVAPELPATAIAAPRTGAVRPFGRLAEEVEGKVVIDTSTSAASVEEYRRLAGSLHQLQGQTGLRTLMVSSALPGVQDADVDEPGLDAERGVPASRAADRCGSQASVDSPRLQPAERSRPRRWPAKRGGGDAAVD